MKRGGLQKTEKQKKETKSSRERLDDSVRLSNHVQFQVLASFFDSCRDKSVDSHLCCDIPQASALGSFVFPSDAEMVKSLQDALGDVAFERLLSSEALPVPDPVLFGLPNGIESVLFPNFWQKGDLGGTDACHIKVFSSSIKARIRRMTHAWAHARGLQSLSVEDRKKTLYGLLSIVRSSNRVRFLASESAPSLEEKMMEYFAEWVSFIFGVRASSKEEWLIGIRRETVSRFLCVDGVSLSLETGASDVRLARSYLGMIGESFIPWKVAENVETFLDREKVSRSHRTSRIVLSKFSDRGVRGFISFLMGSQSESREKYVQYFRSRIDVPILCIPWIEEMFLFVEAFLSAERVDESFALESSRLDSSWEMFSETERAFLLRVFRNLPLSL